VPGIVVKLTDAPRSYKVRGLNDQECFQDHNICEELIKHNDDDNENKPTEQAQESVELLADTDTKT